MADGALQKKVDSTLGVKGSNHDRAVNFVGFRKTKTDDSYVYIPTETDQNDEKNIRALIGFDEKKTDENRQFICSNPTKFSTRVFTSRAKPYTVNFSAKLCCNFGWILVDTVCLSDNLQPTKTIKCKFCNKHKINYPKYTVMLIWKFCFSEPDVWFDCRVWKSSRRANLLHS